MVPNEEKRVLPEVSHKNVLKPRLYQPPRVPSFVSVGLRGGSGSIVTACTILNSSELVRFVGVKRKE